MPGGRADADPAQLVEGAREWWLNCEAWRTSGSSRSAPGASSASMRRMSGLSKSIGQTV